MDIPNLIVSVVFGITGFWLLLQLIKRLAEAEEEMMDMRYELRTARRNIETLETIVKMQREQLAVLATAEVRVVEAQEELEEGEIRTDVGARRR